MKRNSGYNTKQKEKLIDYLIENKDKHMSVQNISAYLTAEGSPVGIATIYRRLDKLVAQGLVRKYIIDEKTGACYQYIGDGSCHEHFHLKCVRCNKLIHINCNHLLGINQHILDHHGFTVDPSKTVFYGVCSECAEDEKE